jgi:rubredoxin
VTTGNNAFVHNDLQLPLKVISGNDKSLLENLNDFAAKQGEELCHWTFQALPPPRGGPTKLDPRRGYYDVSGGYYDQDIEWVQAYGEVAVARLHSRVKKDGPLMGAMCSLGAVITNRRCENGKSIKKKCIPAITNGTIQWPMAVSIWKVGHPELDSAVTDWRANTMTGHLPNIEWDKQTPGTVPAYAWTGAMPEPGELNPSAMPKPGAFPSSLGAGWGSPKIAKVVKCSDIPSKFIYNTDELFYCDHMPNTTSSVSSVDEAYGIWKALTGVWPPTKPCADDLKALDDALKVIAPTLAGSNCSVAYSALQAGLPNFDCDNSDIFTAPTFRDMCCSVCGGKPIPDVPSPAPTPPAAVPYHCSVCNHAYDAQKDGGGKKFEDLPSDWVCPVCGAKKGAYYKQDSGEWAHDHDEFTA